MKYGKLLSLVCAVMIAICSATSGLSASALDAGVFASGTDDETTDEIIEENGFVFKKGENGCLTLTKYNGEETEVTIPSNVNGMVVDTVGYDAFEYMSDLTKVTIPETVKTVDDYAFFACWSLENIVIPDSVEYISKNAFQYTKFYRDNSDAFMIVGDGLLIDCKATEDHIVLPGNVKKIMNSVFYGNESLTAADLGDKITYIGMYAFSGCKSLEEIDIPESVETIDYAAFRSCESLDRLYIPESVKSIGNWAFSDCTNLTIECRPNTAAANAAVEGSVPVKIDWYGDDRDYANLVFSELEDGTLKVDGILSLNGKELIIPAVYNGKIVTVLSEYLFYGFNGKSYIEKISLPDSLVKTENECFWALDSLREINIPNGVTNIENAFSRCDKVTSFIVSDDNPNYAYKNNILTTKDGSVLIRFTDVDAVEYTVGENVTEIAPNAFAGMEKLEKLTIPPNVTEIRRWNTFYNSPNVVIYCYPGTAAKNHALSNSIPFVLLKYGDDRDYDDLYFTELPDGTLAVTGTKSYYEDSIIIPASYNGKNVSRIGSYAFAGLYLTSVKIESGVEIIEKGAFSDCDKIESIDIPGSVKEIYWYSFLGCTSLKSVEIGQGTKIIGRAAFKGCTELKSVYVPDSAEVFGKYIFNDCPSLTVVCSKDSAARSYAESYSLACAEEEEHSVKEDTSDVPSPSGTHSAAALNTSDEALYILRVSLGMEQPEKENIVLLDKDGDGEITSSDALIALRLSAV